MQRLTALAALCLALVAPVLAAPSLAEAQRHPDRYLLIDPPPPSRRVVVVQQPPPPRRVVVRHVQRPPDVLVRVNRTPPPPVQIDPPRSTRPRFFVGAGAGALLRFDEGRDATPSYQLRLGLAVDQAEFAFRFDLAPGFEQGGETGADAALYTAGAGFQYRFVEDGSVHPVLGLGLESVFFNPEGSETARAFAATGHFGVELDVPTRFGAVSLGLEARAHQPLAGDDPAMARLLGVDAHLDFRF